MSANNLTKKVRINLSAYTRVEYSEVIEVSADATEEDLQELASRRYREVDASEFSDDSEYWEKGTVECVSAEPGDTASFIFVDNDLLEI